MPNVLSKLAGLVLAVILIFVWTSFDTFKKHDNLNYITSFTAVTNFVDSVRNKGYITPTMFNQFSEALHATGNVYDIELEHFRKRYNPVYTDPANSATYEDRISIDYDGYYTEQIMGVLFPSNSDPIDSDNRIYKLNVGDYFNVTIKNINRTNATIISDFLFRNNTGDVTRVYIPYGGMVHNEDY